MAEVLLPQGGEMKQACVISCKHDADGRPNGTWHDNPILNSCLYEVEFPDGSTNTYLANMITENLYAQVDQEGRSHAVLDEIIDHHSDGTAMTKDDAFFTNWSGHQHWWLTTKERQLQVQWKDQLTSSISLKDLKDSNVVKLAEHVIVNKIIEEPVFAWWV